MRRKHAWLALDPGLTTGWALIEDDTTCRGLGNIPHDEIRVRLDTLVRSIHASGYWVSVVVEDQPRVGEMSQLGKQLRDVWQAIGAVTVETYELPVRVVTPGVWKPSREARLMKVPRRWNNRPLTTHQRDALRMAAYALANLDKGVPPR